MMRSYTSSDHCVWCHRIMPVAKRASSCWYVSSPTLSLTLPCPAMASSIAITLLNPRLAPAHELACGYHECWEVEITIDEIDTHQRLVGRTLRSLTPWSVCSTISPVSACLSGVHVPTRAWSSARCRTFCSNVRNTTTRHHQQAALAMRWWCNRVRCWNCQRDHHRTRLSFWSSPNGNLAFSERYCY